MAKVYRGWFVGGLAVVDVEEAGRKYELPPRLDLRSHSPSGFAWGYAGSGPAQLALALLADHLEGDDKSALVHYQAFKTQVVARIPTQHEWLLSATDVAESLDELVGA